MKFLKGSNDPSDCRPTGMKIDWEVPGLFNVDLQSRNLSLMVPANRDGSH
ncbi:MAG: hypothetical protein NTW21_02075 [Verrucomicrobia bacterium]|nr:hypothetical protein [Verrucomicrobiota bacterium]